MNLTEIGLKYKTDKATFHHFTPIYDEILKPLKNKKLKFLEIGVLYGSSLKMWEEYFLNASIYGADIFDKEKIKELQQIQDGGIYKNNIFDEIRTTIIQLNQENKEELTALPDGWDIIIDDGGHTMFQQQITLSVLFHKLKSNGIYILEDLHTSYYPDYGANDQNNTIKLLNDLKNKKLSQNSQYLIDNNDFYDLIKLINTIDIYQTKEHSITSIITKK